MTEEWPSYFTGRREHIHTLGVISLSYSAFERDIFTLYAHHPGVKRLPRVAEKHDDHLDSVRLEILEQAFS
jgi:hypothetical protein